MLLSEDVLKRVDFYEMDRFVDYASRSTVTLYWKIQWWQSWLPHKQVISMSTINSNRADGKEGYRMADPEWEELVEQLGDWFKELAPKQREPAKLHLIHGGKKEEEDE